IGRETTPARVFADEVFAGRDVHAIHLVAGDIAVVPMHLRAELVEDEAGLLGNGAQLAGRQGADTWNVAFDHVAGHGDHLRARWSGACAGPLHAQSPSSRFNAPGGRGRTTTGRTAGGCCCAASTPASPAPALTIPGGIRARSRATVPATASAHCFPGRRRRAGSASCPWPISPAASSGSAPGPCA